MYMYRQPPPSTAPFHSHVAAAVVAAVAVGERRRCDQCGGRLGTAAAGQQCHGVWEEKMGPGNHDNIINIGTVIHTPVSYKISFYIIHNTHRLSMSAHTLSAVSIIYDNSMLYAFTITAACHVPMTHSCLI